MHSVLAVVSDFCIFQIRRLKTFFDTMCTMKKSIIILKIKNELSLLLVPSKRNLVLKKLNKPIVGRNWYIIKVKLLPYLN